MLNKIQVHAVSTVWHTNWFTCIVYNMYMYMLLNLLSKESCFCIIHSYMYHLVSLSCPWSDRGGLQLFRHWSESLSKGLAFDSFYVAHGQMLALSPGSLCVTGNTAGGAARKKEGLIQTVRACVNNSWNVGDRILIVYVCYTWHIHDIYMTYTSFTSAIHIHTANAAPSSMR